MNPLRCGIAALALALSAGLAVAQTAAPANETATKTETTAAANEQPPLAGANSFTEAQARDRIASAGFQDVKDLKQDDKGVWRGQATKSGQQVGVALDYRGNVVQQ